MDRFEWSHLSRRLLGLAVPLLFLLLPTSIPRDLDIFSGLGTFIHLSLLSGLIGASFFTADHLLSGEWGRALFFFTPIFAIALFTSFFLLVFFSSFILILPLGSTGYMGYRCMFWSIWGCLSGVSVGAGVKSLALARTLGATGFLAGTLLGGCYVLLNPQNSLQGILFILIPLYLAWAFQDEFHKKGWLSREIDDNSRQWILYWEETTIGPRPWDPIPLDPTAEPGVLIQEREGQYFLVNNSPVEEVYVNKQKGRMRPLREGDRILVQGSEFIFHEMVERTADSENIALGGEP